MKKFLLSTAVILLTQLSITQLLAQQATLLDRAYEHIKEKYGLDKKAIGELIITDQYTSDHNQATHVFMAQSRNGLELFGTSIGLVFTQDGKVASINHRLTPLDKAKVPAAQPGVSAGEAVAIASGSLGNPSRSIPSLSRISEKGVSIFEKSDISLQDIPVKLGYLLRDGNYLLVWKIQIEPASSGLLYQSYVDASTGKSLANDQLTLRCSFEDSYIMHDHGCMHAEKQEGPKFFAPPSGSAGQYRVLPLSIESPSHGDFELLGSIEDPVASPFGWHDTNGAAGNEYTYTRGNNVHAFLDRNWDYISDRNVDGGANLLFDFPFDPVGEPSANQDVAVTNLFFWNNIMHDFSYRYGFNEVAGNFQSRNYSSQGSGTDYVEAHAQFGDNNPSLCGDQANGDTDCLNNADFSTPTDGFNGRMRMFTWDLDNSNKYLDVLEPVEFAGKILTGLAQFGPTITTTGITADVVIADDGTSSGSYACNSLSSQPEVNGKIVIIDRGLCDFSLKVFNAQQGGALGAIICNFEENTITMGAGEMAAQVTIPSVFISRGDCARIRVAAANGLKVSIVAPVSEGGPLRRDGSLDNSIIAHEYGHGISTRLTNGPGDSGCLSASAQHGAAEEASGMGEGWSDFFALVLTVNPGDTGTKKRGIGTYSSKQSVDGRGIRSFPYSTDMDINPHTYDDILFESVPHGVGSVWTAMLWDLYWAFSDAYGWDPDVYAGTGGNNIAIQLVMDGLKYQPCNPGFVDARDAILLADEINNGGANTCLIWEVFARRGLGWNADGGTASSRSDGIEGFETLPACLNELRISKNMTAEITAGEQIEVTLHAVNYTNTQLTNVFIEDPLPDGTTYVTGSANLSPAVGNSLVWSFSTVDPGEEIHITYLLHSNPTKNSVRLLYDDIEGDPFQRWDIDYDPSGFASNAWNTQDVLVRSGTTAWSVGDVEEESKHWIQNYEPYHVTGEYPVYRFYHYFNTETGADGGFLEISNDDKNSWLPLDVHMFRNGYPRRLQYTTFAIPNLYAFSGLSHTELQMTPVYIDLRDYVGQNIYIRYKFGTDDNTAGDGWYFDDVEIMDAVLYNAEACITSDQTDVICAEASQRGTIVDSRLMVSTKDEYLNEDIAVYPNPAGDYSQIVLTVTHPDDAIFNVFDLTGKQVYSAAWKLTEGINHRVLHLDGFTSGMYVVHVQTAGAVYSKKFIKE